MIDHQILFTGEMVRVILAGEKTQTRRVVKPQPEHGLHPCHYVDSGWALSTSPNEHGRSGCTCRRVAAPFGTDVPGDRLWARETWRPWSWHEGEPPCIEYRADGVHREVDYPDDSDSLRYEDWEQRLLESVSDECEGLGLQLNEHGEYSWGDGPNPLRWRPSIHMPKWACRLWLEVVSVKVERLQDITEEGALAEGVSGSDVAERLIGERLHRADFADLWDSLNAKRGHSWDTNPWVWVIEFKRETP